MLEDEIGLFEVLQWICEECQGECCLRFAVFMVDKDDVLHMSDNLQYKHIGPRNTWELCCRTTLSPENRKSIKYECYFYSQGGCPPLVKPKECGEWFCKFQEAVIFGSPLPHSFHGLSMKLRMIYRGFMKERVE